MNRDLAAANAAPQRKPVDVVYWLTSLVAWDGALPALMVVTPIVLQWLWPLNAVARDFGVTIVVITALFVRLIVGWRHVGRNHCGSLTRFAQKTLLCILVICLILIDVLLMILPNPAGVLCVVFGIYAPLMLFVLYPGQEPDDELEPGRDRLSYSDY